MRVGTIIETVGMGKVASFREKFTHRFTPGASAAHAAARINGGDVVAFNIAHDSMPLQSSRSGDLTRLGAARAAPAGEPIESHRRMPFDSPVPIC